MANNAKLSGKFRDGFEDVTPEKLQAFIDRNDYNGFNAMMANNLDQILDKYKKSKKPDPRWLPFMRQYAFTLEGSLPGINAKILRGDVISAAPVDCSLKAWRLHWRASIKNWNEMIIDRKIVRAHWGRLLAWDPQWIRRRADRKGWLNISSYYVGCLLMADKALTEMMSDVSLVNNAADWEKIGITKIKIRLQWLLDISRSGMSSVPTMPMIDNSLSIWTCFEGAKDIRELAACRTSMSEEQDALGNYNEERFGWNLARILFSTKGPLAADLQPTISAYAAKLSKIDFFTRFDYRVEQKVLRAISRGNVQIEKVVEKIQSEQVDIRIVP